MLRNVANLFDAVELESNLTKDNTYTDTKFYNILAFWQSEIGVSIMMRNKARLNRYIYIICMYHLYLGGIRFEAGQAVTGRYIAMALCTPYPRWIFSLLQIWTSCEKNYIEKRTNRCGGYALPPPPPLPSPPNPVQSSPAILKRVCMHSNKIIWWINGYFVGYWSWKWLKLDHVIFGFY